jgi:hypothetical protein
VFFSIFLTHKYREKNKKETIDTNRRNLTHNSHNSETEGSLREADPLTHNSTQYTQFKLVGVGGWQGYVRDLVSIRDRLQRQHALSLQDTHPVYDAIDSVGPVMSPAIETFVRRVIEEYAS